MELDLSNSWLVLAVIGSISIGALLKGITGAGLPLLAVPMLASITRVEDAVVLMVLPGLVANSMLVFSHRRNWQVLKDHRPFLIAGFIGAFIGTWLLSALDDRWLKLLLIAWLGLYLFQYFFHRQAGERLTNAPRVAPLLGLAAGTVQGASGISAHVVAPYFHARKLKMQAYAFALGFAFLLFSVGQFTAISALDLFTKERLSVSLLALLPTIIFIQLGIRLSHKTNEVIFNRIIIGLFIAMEIKLIFDIL
jgi:uncharacterized membrane protein YfcA